MKGTSAHPEPQQANQHKTSQQIFLEGLQFSYYLRLYLHLGLAGCLFHSDFRATICIILSFPEEAF